MKMNGMFRSVLCSLMTLMCLGTMATIVYAGNSQLDVTASNVSGTTSKDPYSMMEYKDDSEQSFYITLSSLTNGPSMTFTSYSKDHIRVSTGLTITKSQVGVKQSHKYDVQTASAGNQYYVYATAPLYYAEVHAVGIYCP